MSARVDFTGRVLTRWRPKQIAKSHLQSLKASKKAKLETFSDEDHWHY